MKCSQCREMMRYGWVVTMVGSFEKVYTVPLCDACLRQIAGKPGFHKLQNLCLASGWAQEPLPGYEALMGRPR